MRFFRFLACALVMPLLASSALAQSAQPSTNSSAQGAQSAPAQQSTAPSLQLRDLPPDPHTLTPAEQEQQKAAQMRAQLTRIATAQANWGKEASASGMSLKLKEVSREKNADGTSITWQLVGTGFTPDMQLTLVRWPLNLGVTAVMNGITVNAAGVAICTGTPASPAPQTPPPAQVPSCTTTVKAGAPIQIASTAAKGEAIRVALISADQKHGAAASLIPYPIENEDKGCKISVIRGSKDDELVLIEGEGFKQDATYTMGTESFGEKHPLNVKINPQGRFVAAVTPWIPNHDAGDTVVFYQSSSCTPTVSFHWGKDTYKAE
jgi:hypothetical protein